MEEYDLAKIAREQKKYNTLANKNKMNIYINISTIIRTEILTGILESEPQSQT